jgi:hypothetical protein
MNEFVELTEVKALGIENCLVLKTPVVKIVNSLVTVACRFELDIKEQAQKYQEKVVEMISRYNFKDTFNSILIWINKAMADMILLGLSVSPSDPQSAKDYYHCSLELMAQSILLPALSLDLQREADK